MSRPNGRGTTTARSPGRDGALPSDERESTPLAGVPGAGAPEGATRIGEPAVNSVYGRVFLAVRRHERELWVLVALTLVLDVALTAYGTAAGLPELNPVAAGVLHRFGVAGLLALKLAVVAQGVACWLVVPRRYGAAIPAGIAAPWGGAAAVNVVVVLVAA